MGKDKLIDEIDGCVLFKFTCNNLSLVAVCRHEVAPVGILHQLIWFVELVQDYLGGFDESSITQNYDVVYQLLEECFDDGMPYINEPALLKQLVPPPSIISTVINTLSTTSIHNLPPTGVATRIPWRQENLKYAHNEIFFDTVEELDMIVDEKGFMVYSSVFGRIDCQSRLSGMPQLILSLNKTPLEPGSVAFHHCVNRDRWEKEGVLTFVPPGLLVINLDGSFSLLEYNIDISLKHIPVLIKPTFKKTTSGCSKIDIKVIPRLGNEKVRGEIILGL
jgi:AP-3 complex subunit mu